jgi:hypothetical protein
MERMSMQRKWVSKWKLLGAVLLVVAACKSAGPSRESRAQEATEDVADRCLGNLRAAQQQVAYVVSCEGLSVKMKCAYQGARVEFVSDCDDPVTVSFSEPKTLFTSQNAQITLEKKGASATEMVGSQGGNHCVCVGSALCTDEDCFQFRMESKTGSLDVYTSGPGDDDEKKPL